MKSVGIDIGSSQIKAVEIQTTSKGFVVSQYVMRALSQNPAHDQDLEIIEFLRELSSRYDPAQTKFCVALRQDRVAIRNKSFPFLERLKINKALPLELEEDLPFSGDNSIFDAKIIRTYGNTADVLACAAPKNHVLKLIQILSDSGIQADVISTEGTAFANLFERWNDSPPAFPPRPPETEGFPKPETPLQIVVNFGHSRTLVCAFSGSVLLGVRSILWGGKNIAEAISKKYEMPVLEAGREMELKAFILTGKQEASHDAKVFSDTIARSVREFGRDLQLSMLEFRTEHNGIVQKIDLTGPVSLIQGLGPFLTQILETPVNRLKIFDHFPHIQFEKTDITDTRLGLALGLAIEGLKKPRNPPVNFLKNEFAKKNYLLQNFWQRWKVTAQFAAAAFVLFVIWSFIRVELTSTLVTQTEELLRDQGKKVAGLSGRNLSERSINKYISESRKKIKDFKTAEGLYQMNSALEILKRISESVPAKYSVGLDVKRFNVVDNLVTLEGYVRSPRELSSLQSNLNSMAIDGKINSQRSNLKSLPNQITFALSFRVDRNLQKAGL